MIGALMRCMFVLLCVLSVAPAYGQAPVNATTCHGVFQATVSSGRLHPRFATCEPVMHAEIANYLRNDARDLTDQRVLARVLMYGTAFRDPAIFDAAATLASDAAASPQAQLVGWFMMIGQHSPSIHLRSFGADRATWFDQRIDSCEWSEPTDAEYAVDHGARTDYLERIAAVAAVVRTNPAFPERTKSLARCSAELVDVLLPVASPSSHDVQFARICGNVFEVRNDAGSPVQVRWILGDSVDSGELTVAAHSTARFDVFAPGTVRLFLINQPEPVATLQTAEGSCSS